MNVGLIDCDQSELASICTTFDVSGYPTILFLKDKHVYKYKGERTVEGFKAFLDGGFEEAEKEVLPRKLEGFDLYIKQFQKIANQFARSIHILFDKVGFGHLPHEVMYGIAGCVFLLPLVLMCYVICCMKDDVGNEEDERKEQESSKKPASSSRREKLE